MSGPPEEQPPTFAAGQPVELASIEPVPQPEQPVPQPEQPVPQPEQPVQQPEQPTVPYIPAQPQPQPQAYRPPAREPRRQRLEMPSYSDDGEHEASKAPIVMSGLALALAVVALLAVIGIIPIGGDSGLVNESDLAPASVGTTQLVDGAVSLAKIDSELAATISDPQPGPRGPEGPIGERGPRGKQGATGPAGVATTEVITERARATSSTSSLSAIARCPAAGTLLGGGVAIDAPSGTVVITSSAPDESGRSWHGSALDTSSSAQSWTLTSYAICTKAEPPVTTTPESGTRTPPAAGSAPKD